MGVLRVLSTLFVSRVSKLTSRKACGHMTSSRHMPDKHIWLSAQTVANLAALRERWGLSDSATIAKAVSLAVSGPVPEVK